MVMDQRGMRLHRVEVGGDAAASKRSGPGAAVVKSPLGFAAARAKLARAKGESKKTYKDGTLRSGDDRAPGAGLVARSRDPCLVGPGPWGPIRRS